MTRAEIAGALQMLNSQGTRNRAVALRKMLEPKFHTAVVNRIIADLKSYAEWSARLDLEDDETTALGAAASKSADPRPPKEKRGAKGKGG